MNELSGVFVQRMQEVNEWGFREGGMKRFGMCLTFHLSVSSVTSIGLISGKPVLLLHKMNSMKPSNKQ